MLTFLVRTLCAEPFDAAPFALSLPDGQGLLWEDPREIHQVVVEFETAPPESVRLEYWGSRWPEQHLPKDREPGGGDVGWMELGNWYNGGWRRADTTSKIQGATAVFEFNPVNAKEFPKLSDYPARFRYTLKLRVTSDAPLPKVKRFQALTDSAYKPGSVRVVWKSSPRETIGFEVFNGILNQEQKTGERTQRVSLRTAVNSDPNTFDRTQVTVKNGETRFTFAVDDLAKGPLFLPHFGAAILPDGDTRDYAALAAAQAHSGAKTLYDRVSQLPEQTWRSAWDNMPAKKSHIYFPMGLDGGRQRFLVEADGSIRFRSNDHFLRNRPGRDTPRLELERAPTAFHFGSWGQPKARHIEEDSMPICSSSWQSKGVEISQTVYVTPLGGSTAAGPVPAPDTCAVLMARFTLSNTTAAATAGELPLSYSTGDSPGNARWDEAGLLWVGTNLRGQVVGDHPAKDDPGHWRWVWTLAPGESKTLVLKLPYVLLTQESERQDLAKLDFDTERTAVAGYWRRRLNESARLVTPEPVLNEFYRATAGHLLINCEREPGSDRRFARVGSFAYGAYGNESCMMVVDLDRRGYHREAQECLDAWLQYQGTVGLPGDFSSAQGVLYGAGGYEAGGYNQHHGWILWCLAEHFRFTRDEAWLRRSAPGLVAGAEWILQQTARTAGRHELERGLLPAGSLEDIGDWWTWLSTSCYTWRGLEAAGWALEQIGDPAAERIRAGAAAFHARLLANFRAACQRSPVVRLRDGTAVPHIPSYVHRRGRSFGWICETLEGALHLLITGALEPHSAEADWIVKDYEDNLFLSNQYGYTLDDFEQYWFGRGGMSMQACLLLDVEPYLYRDDVKQALRAMFNAIAVSHFPDVHMNTEHALPEFGDWRGDHYKSSDEANACGWLRQIFVREQGETLLVGQAVPRNWLATSQTCGLENAATYFGKASILYAGGDHEISARLQAPDRNAPKTIRLRFRTPRDEALTSVLVNGQAWQDFSGDWVQLPGNIGSAQVVVHYAAR